MGIEAVAVIPIRKLVFLLAIALFASTGWAQSYTLIHNFSGGADGEFPVGGLTLGPGGSLYGTAVNGGSLSGQCLNGGGCGLVFRLAR